MGILELWGGLFYLLNKIFFSVFEKTQRKILQILSWAVYLIGLPAWVIIFIQEKNWIAASIESAGALSMILRLTRSIRGKEATPKILNTITGIFVVMGIGYSAYDLGGLHHFTQFLELSMTTGFLLGTYLLARENNKGYLFFLLMNASNAILMLQEKRDILMIQQIVSMFFVLYAWIQSQKNKKTQPI